MTLRWRKVEVEVGQRESIDGSKSQVREGRDSQKWGGGGEIWPERRKMAIEEREQRDWHSAREDQMMKEDSMW